MSENTTNEPLTKSPTAGAPLRGGIAAHHAPSNRTGASLSLEIVTSLSEFEKLESDWRGLTADTGGPFQTFGWNQAWYRNFADRFDGIFVFVLRKGREAIAILPCYRDGKEIRLACDNVCACQDLIARAEDDARNLMIECLNWLREESPSCRFHFANVEEGEWLYSSVAEGDETIEHVIFLSKESDIRPEANLEGGYRSYIRTLPEDTGNRLRGALKKIDHSMPRARVCIKRDHEIRVDALEDSLFFLRTHGCLDRGTDENDEALFLMLGEVAKDQDVGMQVARLIDYEDTLALDIGFARSGEYHSLFSGFDHEFEDVHPLDCLFLSRINDWIGRNGVEKAHFQTASDPVSVDLAGGQGTPVFSMLLMLETLMGRVRQAGHSVIQRGRASVADSKEQAALAR